MRGTRLLIPRKRPKECCMMEKVVKIAVEKRIGNALENLMVLDFEVFSLEKFIFCEKLLIYCNKNNLCRTQLFG